MTERRRALFLERQSYRRRRMVDAIRLLPILGGLLWAVPLLWPGETVATSRAILYIFGVWLALVAASAVMARLFLPESHDAGLPPADPASAEADNEGLADGDA